MKGNNKSERNGLLRALASTKLTLVILIVFAGAIAAATFIETRYGSEGARALVYNARWFEVLLAVLALNLLASLLCAIPYRAFQTGYVITHSGFIVVLVAAGITRFFGYEGMMSIREGAETDFVFSSVDYIKLVSGEDTATFPVRLYKPGANSIRHDVMLGGARYRVSIEEYWPQAETSLVASVEGDPAFVFSATDRMRGAEQSLRPGEALRVDGVTAHFEASVKDVGSEALGYGNVVIRIDGRDYRLAVSHDSSKAIEAGGYTFRIKVFAPNFRVGEGPNPDGDMINPAVRVAIDGPAGETSERLLFAFHPDFKSSHGSGEASAVDIDMKYEYERNIFFFVEGKELLARADFEVRVLRPGDTADGGAITPGDGASDAPADGARVAATDNATVVPAGEAFAVKPETRVSAGYFALRAIHFWRAAAEVPTPSEDEDAPPVVRLTVDDGAGQRDEAFVAKWGAPARLALAGREIRVGYGPVRIDLPYRIHLDDFMLVTYPGSNNPASFESHVRVYDEANGVNGQPARIYMNHPLSYAGFKHFQASYDSDRHGTVLSVNHDPGKTPTYFGYVMIAVGFLITLTRGMWYRPRVGGGVGKQYAKN